MLKWAVSGPRQTYLPNVSPSCSSEQQRKHLKRKSSNMSFRRSKTSWFKDANQYTSTPVQTCSKNLLESPSNKIDPLKDLSNIVSELSPNTTQSGIWKTPENTKTHKNVPNNYASTLPTFDIEYSPCALISGPMLALRGVGVPDSYFKKPRYVIPHLKESLKDLNDELSLETKTLQESESILKYPTYMEDSTLSSTKMGDVTLERMIDAILESNCKEGKLQKSEKYPQQQQPKMSPTYTPAEDPASDLHEIWDSEKARYRQNEHNLRTRLTRKSLFNEREICSPLLQEIFNPVHLKRQRGLRRKQKIYKIGASVVSSAQKLLGKGSQTQTLCTHPRNTNKVSKADIMNSIIAPRKLLHNLSLDSGHNSSSDYEEGEDDRTLDYKLNDIKFLDNTNSRLSSSVKNLNDI